MSPPVAGFPFLAAVAGCVLALAGPGFGQDVGDLRDELRDALRDTHFASSFAGLIFVADELELSGARYRIDDDFDTEITTIAFPFRRVFRPWGQEETGLYVEGTVGYARASRGVDDIYGGGFPGLETSVDADWTTYGGLVGLGPELRLAEQVTLTPILNAGLARIESDAGYGGPGAATSAQIFDGIAFNWSGWAASMGCSARLDWVRPLGEDHELEVVGRYDLRWTETFDTDDSVQEFSSRLQLLTLRADLVGPTGLDPFGHPLDWRALAGYRHFVEGSIYGVHDLALLGGALELDTDELLPIGSVASLSGGVLLGDDLWGFTVGLGLEL